MLPLLGALGAVGGGAVSIAKTVDDAKANRLRLEEQRRHDLAVEQSAKEKGLYLRPYKGYGFKKLPMKLPRRAVTDFELKYYGKKLKLSHFHGEYLKDNLPKQIGNKECGIVNMDSILERRIIQILMALFTLIDMEISHHPQN